MVPVPIPQVGSSTNSTPDTSPDVSPSLAAELDRLERAGYEGYATQQRAEHEQNRREDQAAHLRSAAQNHRNRASDLAQQAIQARRDGLTIRADYLTQQANDDMRAAYELEDEADNVLAGNVRPDRVDVDSDRDWDRINDDVGTLAPGGVETGDTSALTGTDRPPPVESTRRYGERGGSRPPLAAHQRDLERAMPRDANGDVQRTADPRTGDWFGLSNDGGPSADPTRAINCLDCVLSFFDTWAHGRPRVSAPRTFDAYADGDPTRPLDGEADGPGRVEDMTGGRYQGLCPYVGHLPPQQAQQAVNHAMNNLHLQLLNGGHGSFAFVITGWEGGSSHAWAAINQNGTILYVDPQSGHIAENLPLYGHYGQPYDGNVVMMDALVLDPQANPMPLAQHPTGAWSVRPPVTTTSPAPTPTPAPSPSPQPGPVTGTDQGPALEAATTAPAAPPPGSAPPGGPPPAGDPTPSDGPAAEPGPSSQSESTSDTQPAVEPQPETAPESAVETEPAVEAEFEATIDAEQPVETAVAVEPSAEVGVEAEPEAAAEPQPSVEANPEPSVATEPGPEPDLAQSVAEAAPELAESGPAVEPATAVEPEAPATPDTAQEPPATQSPARETDAKAEERRILAKLREDNPAAAAVLDAADAEAERVAAKVSRDLHRIVASLDGFGLPGGPEIIGEENRVKELPSLARKFVAASDADPDVRPEDVLADINDRVRFSIQLPEEGYGAAVQATLDQLRSLGYEIDPDEIKNFWRPGNRHNGVNVTARTRDGFVLEIQFPTELSWRLGKRTHDLYKIVRLESADPAERVEAFLEILRLNKEFGISQRMPEGLDQLPDAKNTSLAKWAAQNPEVWAEYESKLRAQGKTFADVAAQLGLGPEEFPDAEGLGLHNGRHDRLPRGAVEAEGTPDERRRGMGGDRPTSASGDVDGARAKVEVQPDLGGDPAVRRPLHGSDSSDQPSGGGADSAGAPSDGAAQRGGDPADERGGRAAEPELTGSTDVQPERGVETPGTDTATASPAESQPTAPPSSPTSEASDPESVGRPHVPPPSGAPTSRPEDQSGPAAASSGPPTGPPSGPPPVSPGPDDEPDRPGDEGAQEPRAGQPQAPDPTIATPTADERGARGAETGPASIDAQPEPGATPPGPQVAATPDALMTPPVVPPAQGPPPTAPPSVPPPSGPPVGPPTPPPSGPTSTGPNPTTPAAPPPPSGPPVGPPPAQAGGLMNTGPAPANTTGPGQPQSQPTSAYDPTVLSERQVRLDMNSTPRPGETPAEAAHRAWRAAEDLERRVFERFDRLPEAPPRFDVFENDQIYGPPPTPQLPQPAHTLLHHGAHHPLERSPIPNLRTIGGRIYGDPPWQHASNWSTRWIDAQTMQRVIRTYVQDHWEDIRDGLALDESYSATFNAGQLVGEGYMNGGYGGTGPQSAEYFQTNLARIVIRIVPGSDPPVPYIVTAYPVGEMRN